MNPIRKRILNDVQESTKYYPFSEHRDLIAFCVCIGDMISYEENEEDADFCEAIIIVDKNWLFDFMDEENPRDYLINEYTSDDSRDWYQEALITNHLVGVMFN